MELTITHDEENQQFVVLIDDKLSTLKYSISSDGKTLDYYSTFVPPELRERHLGRDLVKFALDFALQNNYKVNPSCPFVSHYIHRHPEYKKVLPS